MTQLTVESFFLLQIPLMSIIILLNRTMCSMSAKIACIPYPVTRKAPLIYIMMSSLVKALLVVGYLAINYELLQKVQLQ